MNITQTIDDACMEMANRRQCWLDSVCEGTWNPDWESPFGEPITGSFRAFLEAQKHWAEAILKAEGY